MKHPLLAAALLIFGCAGAECPDGQVRQDDECADYEAGEPVSAEVWQPGPGTTWQWQLSGTIDTSLDVAMYDVDLFDTSEETLQALLADGRIVICYFSAGSIEDWREDAGDFDEDAIGRGLSGWEGERWLDITHPSVRSVMEARLDLAVQRGCDGVEPDNVDGYANNNGVGLNATEQLAYNRFLADAARSRGLSVGLKNDLDQIEALEPWFDWALNEECAAYDECGRLSAFTDAGKAVFHAEYVDDFSDAPDLAGEVCGVAPGLSTLIKTWDLGSEYLACF